MIVIIFVSVACVGCDQATKVLADSYLPKNEMVSYLNDTVRIGYVENSGAFLGMGGQLSEEIRFIMFQAIAGIFIVAMFIYSLIGSNLGLGAIAGISLVFSGGASNLFDRVVNDGAVIDFLNIGIGFIRTGIFNIADVAIMIGGLLFILSQSTRSGVRE